MRRLLRVLWAGCACILTTTTADPVTGMTCEHCARGHGGADGVSEVRVDLNPDGESAVTVGSAAPLTAEAVAAALDEAGDYHLAGWPGAAEGWCWREDLASVPRKEF